jgi:hypothetical protein
MTTPARSERALHLAIATINARSPMTDDQAMALKEFEIDKSGPFYTMLSEKQQAGFLRREPEYLAAHPDEIRTIRTRHGTFEVNLRGMMDLADVVSADGFTIALGRETPVNTGAIMSTRYKPPISIRF